MCSEFISIKQPKTIEASTSVYKLYERKLKKKKDVKIFLDAV